MTACHRLLEVRVIPVRGRTPGWTPRTKLSGERGQLVFRTAGADVVVQRARAAPVSLSAYSKQADR
jgi:hypothetical protein